MSGSDLLAMRNGGTGPAVPPKGGRGPLPDRVARQVLAYCGGMAAGTLFGLGSVVLIEALTYPESHTLANLMGLPPAGLLLILLSILAAVLSANLIPFVCARWLAARILPRMGWIAAAVTGGLASLAGLLMVDCGLYDFAILAPPGGFIISSMAFACGAVAGLVYRALGGFRDRSEP